jgi:Zn-dependent protease
MYVVVQFLLRKTGLIHCRHSSFPNGCRLSFAVLSLLNMSALIAASHQVILIRTSFASSFSAHVFTFVLLRSTVLNPFRHFSRLKQFVRKHATTVVYQCNDVSRAIFPYRFESVLSFSGLRNAQYIL